MMRFLLAFTASTVLLMARGAAPPGGAPFANVLLAQPVPGASLPATSAARVCDVVAYGAKDDNSTNNTHDHDNNKNSCLGQNNICCVV